MMAAINTRIVRRSNALLGYRYGRDFRYSECARSTRAARSGFFAGVGDGRRVSESSSPSLRSRPEPRALLAKMVPAPGEGPSPKEVARQWVFRR